MITLAYADALDLLLKPDWPVEIVDMVLHEVTRNQTPTSERIAQWVRENRIAVIETKIHRHYTQTIAASSPASPPRKSNLGEQAIQEAMNDLSLSPGKAGVFLFEDHKIARASFLLPDNCRKVSTRAYLLFLEDRGLIESAAETERRAILAGRSFSQLRFPPD
ncbi:hypothetical protein FAZ95_13395 [Trinickia violacea]|uniref:Uncharacterized protein n=1 Tax=Trinickia violacea TaxID=2571746 RepID=A0A4P8IQZ4_9BURK|nr:hypothetical protein [Trinickia violacea]QCP50085.1 hypothetical protein FAZ95_13395 [Trinickia violacea]